VACKKPKTGSPEIITPKPTEPAVISTRAQLTKDSIFLYAKEVYLWNDALPTYELFNPRKYILPVELDNYNKELFDITQLKINPSTGKPFEFKSATSTQPKYSYIKDADSDKAPTGTVPSVSLITLEGIGSDFGIALAAVGSKSSYQIYLRYVSPNSSAAKNLLNRGDVITEINGRTFGSNYDSEVIFINTALDQTSLSLSGKKSDGSPFTKTLTKSTYTSSPIYKDTIITSGIKKIGYLAFARFSNPNNATAPLNKSFAKFLAGGVTDLVVDLRYNGGGYVATAEVLANLIAPNTLSGSTMFTEYFNSTMQSGNATILKKQPLLSNGKSQYQNGNLVTYFNIDYSIAANGKKFQKIAGLSALTKVVFLVSSSTASASELVINVLKPHMDVKIVSSKDNSGNANTYGKPVGFFPVTIDKYDVYFSMFETKNSKGEGDYYAGFAPNVIAFDDVTRDFGDPQESEFKAAINYLVNNSLTAKSPVATIMGTTVTLSSSDLRNIGNDESFKGMIETRYILKK
jgi:hypothetical protein